MPAAVSDCTRTSGVSPTLRSLSARRASALERAGDGDDVQVGPLARSLAQDADGDFAGGRIGLDQPRDALRGREVRAEHAQADGSFEAVAQTLDVELARQSPELGDVANHSHQGTLRSVQRFVLRLLATALAVLLAANYLSPDLISVDSQPPLVAALVFALILGLLNAFLRPILLLLTLPLNLLTLGLFTLVVNAIVFWLASRIDVAASRSPDFGAALLGAVVVSVVSFVASRVLEVMRGTAQAAARLACTSSAGSWCCWSAWCVVSLGIGFAVTEAVPHAWSRPDWVGIATLQFLPLLVRALLFLVVGGVLCAFGVVGLYRSLGDVLPPYSNQSLLERIYEYRLRQGGPRIVCIGGGTGMPTVLRGLKHHSANITAIVTVGDDGGSSGRLRREHGILPPGDFRNNIVALAEVEPLMARLFQYRFGEGSPISAATRSATCSCWP